MSMLEDNRDATLHPHGDTHGHGSRRGYLIGFVLSAVLTAVPFWLVMTGVLADVQATVLAIMALAFVQIVVHTIFFLHVNTRSEGGWTLMALVPAVVRITIASSGSPWINRHRSIRTAWTARGVTPAR